MQAISVYENLPWNILSNSSTPTTKSNSFFILIPLAKYSAITSVELKLLRKVVEVMGRSEVFVTVIDTSGCYSGDGGAAVDYSSFVPTGIFTIKSCIDVLNGKIFSDSNSNSNNDNNKKDADSKPAVISYKNFTFNASLVSTHNDNDPPPPSSLKVTKFVPRGSILPHALALTRSGLFSTNINGSMPLARFLALCSREGVDALVAGTAGGGSSSKLFLLAGRTFGEAALCEVVDEVEAEVEVEVEGELEFDFDFDCDELLPVALLFCSVRTRTLDDFGASELPQFFPKESIELVPTCSVSEKLDGFCFGSNLNTPQNQNQNKNQNHSFPPSSSSPSSLTPSNFAQSARTMRGPALSDLLTSYFAQQTEIEGGKEVFQILSEVKVVEVSSHDDNEDINSYKTSVEFQVMLRLGLFKATRGYFFVSEGKKKKKKKQKQKQKQKQKLDEKKLFVKEIGAILSSAQIKLMFDPDETFRAFLGRTVGVYLSAADSKISKLVRKIYAEVGEEMDGGGEGGGGEGGGGGQPQLGLGLQANNVLARTSQGEEENGENVGESIDIKPKTRKRPRVETRNSSNSAIEPSTTTSLLSASNKRQQFMGKRSNVSSFRIVHDVSPDSQNVSDPKSKPTPLQDQKKKKGNIGGKGGKNFTSKKSTSVPRQRKVIAETPQKPKQSVGRSKALQIRAKLLADQRT